MKKLTISLLFIFTVVTAYCQTSITITNNTSCDLGVTMAVQSQSTCSHCTLVDYSIPAGTSVTKLAVNAVHIPSCPSPEYYGVNDITNGTPPLNCFNLNPLTLGDNSGLVCSITYGPSNRSISTGGCTGCPATINATYNSTTGTLVLN